MYNSLEEYVNNNQEKKFVVIQGLGFVGSVMSLVCANAISEDYAVIGVDLQTPKSLHRISSLNNGTFPLQAEDPKISLFFENTKANKNFYATFDESSYSYADVIIIDINLDVQKYSKKDYSLDSYNVDLSGFQRAIQAIGKKCKENALILVETTVPPGTTVNVVKPIIFSELKKRSLTTENIKIAHSYERVMPGPNYIDSIQNYPRAYSGINDHSADAAMSFLETIINIEECDLTRLNCTTSTELAKVLENSYRATNIAFAVEWSRFAEEAGVDLWSIVKAIRVRKTHNNLMFPNIGVGGYCLTKDPLLANWARKTFFGSEDDLKMSIKSVSINDQMPLFAYKRIKNVFGSINNYKVVFLGVSYRGDVGDTRFSPVESLLKLVETDTNKIVIHDPYVKKWEETGINTVTDLNDVFNFNPDLIIISTAHSFYKSEEIISKILNLPKCMIFDSVGLLNEMQIEMLSVHHTVSVIGRGNASS